MRIIVLGLMLGVFFLFGLQHAAVAAPTMQPGATQISTGQTSAAEQVYYYGRRGYVHGSRGGYAYGRGGYAHGPRGYAYGRRGYVAGPYGHGCVGSRRCVGGYYNGVCRSWAACR